MSFEACSSARQSCCCWCPAAAPCETARAATPDSFKPRLIRFHLMLGRSCPHPPGPYQKNSHIDRGIGHCRFLLWFTYDRPRLVHGPRKGAVAKGRRALFWTNVEAVGRTSYLSLLFSAPRHGSSRCFLGIGKARGGSGARARPMFLLGAVPRHGSSKC